jgi:hypothetical protein
LDVAARVWRTPDSHYGQTLVSQALQTANTTNKCRPGAQQAPINKLGIDYHQYCSSSGDTSICTSTAYNGCQTSFIYIIWMWDEYGLGVQPQSKHFTMSYRLGVAQISDKIPKAWSAWAAVRGGDTDPYAHPQHIKVVKHLIYI